MSRVGEETTAERVGKNDARFREANERLAEAADMLELSDDGMLPFLCECADMECTEIVQLSRAEYEEIRASSVTFMNATGHERNGLGWARPVEVRERYTVVEKIGEAADVAVELDPRREDGE